MSDLPSSPDTGPSFTPSRRHLLIGAVAGAATLGGVGLAWRNYAPSTIAPPIPESTLWELEFPTLDGSSLLKMNSFRGKPLLLNFWATWCPPCVEELPLLSSFYRENTLKGWQVLGLAIDQVDPVKRFLARTPVTFPVVLAGLPGMEISRSLGNLSGALPFTVVLGLDGVMAHRKMGKVTPDDLRAWTLLK